MWCASRAWRATCARASMNVASMWQPVVHRVWGLSCTSHVASTRWRRRLREGEVRLELRRVEARRGEVVEHGERGAAQRARLARRIEGHAKDPRLRR